MSFEYYLKEQFQKHPSMQPQDVVKLCYQAAYGAEHLLSDLSVARKYLEQEFFGVSPGDGDLYEELSEQVCRVNLAVWKKKGLPLEWLFAMFVSSVRIQEDGTEVFLDYLRRAESTFCELQLNFSKEEWTEYLSGYEAKGRGAVHHSETYREKECPAYRIVNRRFTRLFPVLEQTAKALSSEQVYVIAIDGRAASGKSTMAEQLKEILNAEIIHMDDFFLPLALRTEERLASPGGNVHYERFLAEVIPFLSEKNEFSYRRFDCGCMDYHGEVRIGSGRFRIVEGSYSQHPLFGNYADLTIFSDVAPKEQLQRIKVRNGAEMAQMFESHWIPMEESYFSTFAIQEKSDICL